MKASSARRPQHPSSESDTLRMKAETMHSGGEVWVLLDHMLGGMSGPRVRRGSVNFTMLSVPV